MRTSSRLLVAAVLALSASVALDPRGAGAATPAELRETIDAIVRQRHPTDTPETWTRLGPGAPKVIIAMADEAKGSFRRARLVEGLSHFDDPEAVEYVRKTASESGASEAVRLAAIRGLGRGPKDADGVAKFLSDADPQVRFTAAETLKRMGVPRAQEQLDKYLPTEKVTWIAQRLKGEFPKPAISTLAPSATSEDRANPQLEGQWRGFWVAPAVGGKGMVSRPAALKLTLEGTSEARGELKLGPAKKGGAPVDAILTGVEARASRLRGALPGTVLPPKPAAAPGAPASVPGTASPTETIDFDAEMSELGGGLTLVMRASRVGGFIILRKD